MASYKHKRRWTTKAKQWIIKYAGGCCQSCGYDKWAGNLAFHHTKHKIASIHELFNNTASWERILKEADKCVLVCHNCHGEIHAGLRECPEINLSKRLTVLAKIISEQPVPKTKQFHNCRCGKQIDKNHKYCSQQCHYNALEQTIWPLDLPELVNKSSKRAVAAGLGVSDKAVAKRLRNHHNQ